MSKIFVKRDDLPASNKVSPASGKTLSEILAPHPNVTAQEAQLYNWGTTDKKEVNRALFELIGCQEEKEDPLQSVLDSALGTTKIVYIPEPWKKTGFELEKTHVIKVKKRLPPPAVSITELTKWFIPGETADGGETCDIKYYLEGVKERADKVQFEVWGSNYSKPTATVEEGFVKVSFADCDVPVCPAADLTGKDPRASHSVPDFRGESKAIDGMLKPRGGSKRYLNAANSPYTVVIRFFKEDADKKARIDLKSFWPQWQVVGSNPPSLVDASLLVKWKTLDDNGKLKYGQLLVWDKTDKPVYRVALDKGKLDSGSLDLKDKVTFEQDKMPYRVQIQAHSDWDEDNGLALAAMHTEVRLWVHKDTGTKADPVKDEKQCLVIDLAPFRPESADPAEGSTEWYKLKLAQAGFHPGPVNDSDETGPASTALPDYNAKVAQSNQANTVKWNTDITRQWANYSSTTISDAKSKIKAAKNEIDAAYDKALEAKNAAADAATKAAAAKTAADDANLAVDQAKTAEDNRQSDASTKWTSAKAKLAAAETKAGEAKAAAESAKVKTDAADRAIAEAKMKAATASELAVTDDKKAAAVASTAKDFADDTKTAAAGAPANVKSACATAATDANAAGTAASQSAVDAKAMADAAADSEAKSSTAANLASDSATKWAGADAAAHDANGKTSLLEDEGFGFGRLFSSSTGGAIGPVHSAAIESAVKADAAKTAADQAKTDADALEAAALDAKNKAATAATAADTAKSRATTFKGSAETADNLAAADQTSKTIAMNSARAAASTTAAASPLYLAIVELQRSHSKDKVKPFSRLIPDGKPSAETQTLLKDLAAETRPWFGDPSNQGDYTITQAKPLLKDKSKNMIVWVDDRHTYTSGAPDPGSTMAMLDYRGPMDIGDHRVAADRRSTARPWLPLEVQIPLLSKADPLLPGSDAPAVTKAMRSAIGPLRIDWTFEDLPPETDNIPATTDAEVLSATEALLITFAAYSGAKVVVKKAKEAKEAAQKAKDKTAAASTKADEAKAATVVAAAKIALAETAANDLVAAANLALQKAVDALAKAQAAKTEPGKQAEAQAAAQTTAGQCLTAKGLAGNAVSAMGEAKSSMGTANTKATEAKDAAADGAAYRTVVAAKDMAHAVKTEADSIPSPDSVRNAVDASVTSGSTAVTDAADAKGKTGSVKTKADLLTTGSFMSPIDIAVNVVGQAQTAVQQASSAADASSAAALLANRDDAIAKADAAKMKADAAHKKAETAKQKISVLKVQIDEVDTLAATAQSAALKSKNSAQDLFDKAAAAVPLAEAEQNAKEALALRHQATMKTAENHRPKRYVQEILGENGMGKKAGSKLYCNCPATVGGVDYGGIRPDALDTYYKAPFGFDKTASLRPWLAMDDSSLKVVCSTVHDDLGQETEKLFEKLTGTAGAYLRPSTIGGDGYRFCAQVSFKPLPGSADLNFKNRETLDQRYAQLPRSYTAGLRNWRKTSFKGYVPWMPSVAAGWDAMLNEARDFYKAAHVHFAHEGPNRDTPQMFKLTGDPAGDLIDATEFESLVKSKLDQPGSPYQSLAAKYTPGYVWPYLDKPHYGVATWPASMEDFSKHLYGKIEEKSWDLFSHELMHLLIKRIEALYGRFRGHVMAEFTASPKLLLYNYKCSICSEQAAEIANDPTSSVTVNVGAETFNITERMKDVDCRKKASGCTGKFGKVGQRVIEGVPLCAIGRSLGGCWLFVPGNAATWAHEIGHHRQLEHAQANKGDAEPAPGSQVKQHDSETNPAQAAAPQPHQKAWDRFCIMSYDHGAPQRFCGKCLLKNRGWAVEAITNPDGAKHD